MKGANEKTMKIRIVEDERAHAEAISRSFGAALPDARVSICATLAEYRAGLASDLPDIVLIDLNLPDGSALEALTCPAEEGAFPLLIMTAHGNEEMAVAAMKAGALDYIVKSAQAFACMPQTVERALREWNLLRKHRQAELSLCESESRFRRILQEIPSIAFKGYGVDGTVRYWNLASELFYGYSAGEAIGRSLLDLVIPEGMRAEEKRRMLRMAETGRADPPSEQCLLRRDGSRITVLSCHAVVRRPGEAPELYGLDIDISERKINEEQLEYLATHDELTGLANRALFHDRLEQSLHYAKRSGRIVAVLLLDLDRFKIINDSLGHSFGDRLLSAVAQRLERVVRDTDTVARLGGDEFVLLLAEVTEPDDVGLLASRILHELAVPHRIEGREIVMSASLGISLYPKDSDEGATLIRNADIAMYRAKQEGGGVFSFYAPEMNQRAMETMEIESALRQALERGEFTLYYQPKVDLASGRISGCEALIRWLHPRRGVVAPADFIPLAEETGLIVPIGTWVLKEACRQVRAWQAEGVPIANVAVNLSARQFRTGDLPGLVREVLGETGLDPHLLELEMTESMVMADHTQVVAVMEELTAIGVRLSLDDFGTGYSSFAHLSHFPINHLKIDRSFIRQIVTDPNSATIATSIIAMAHRMRLKAIAEGVETEAQLAYLRKQGCDEIQGYLLSRPLPASEYAALVRRYAGFSCLSAAEQGGGRTLLIVHDEPHTLDSLQRALGNDGYRILTASDAFEGLELLARENVQVVLSDQRMARISGSEFFDRVRVLHPDTVRVVIAGQAEQEKDSDSRNRDQPYSFLLESWSDELLRGQIQDSFRWYETNLRSPREATLESPRCPAARDGAE